MASAEKIITMDVEKNKLLEVLTNYEAYPEFMDGVSAVEVQSRDGDVVKAKYDLNLIKTFSYILILTKTQTGVSWTLDSGDIFSTNSGSWELEDLGDGTTQVTYNVEIDIKVKMIGTGLITKKLVKTSLPSLMKSVEKRAQSL